MNRGDREDPKGILNNLMPYIADVATGMRRGRLWG